MIKFLLLLCRKQQIEVDTLMVNANNVAAEVLNDKSQQKNLSIKIEEQKATITG